MYVRNDFALISYIILMFYFWETYYFAWVDQTYRPFYIAIQHIFSGHMTNIAHLESHMINIEQLGSHMTNIEHFWSYVMNIAHFSSMSSHTRNTAPVLRFVFIGTTPSVAFVNASGLVGDAKRLCLPCFDGFCHERKCQSPSLRLILYPIVNPPTQKLYIN